MARELDSPSYDCDIEFSRSLDVTQWLNSLGNRFTYVLYDHVNAGLLCTTNIKYKMLRQLFLRLEAFALPCGVLRHELR